MTATTKRILSVRVRSADDDSPDLSYLGEYSDRADETCIDREERGDRGRHELRYFNLGLGELSDLETCYERAEAYNRGEWGMIGIWATAEVQLSGDLTQTIRSGGLWGIESDSGAAYFAEIAANELTELSRELEALGFSAEEIAEAIDGAESDLD